MTGTKTASSTKQIALIIILSALANVLGFPPFSIPLGEAKIHFMQLPIIFAGLAIGALGGGVVGFIGAMVSAFVFPPPSGPNPFILIGNAILGLFTGFFYFRLRRIRPPIVPQLISVLGAIAIQFPYTYFSDVYLASLSAPLVFFTVLPLLFVEDIISLGIAHIILFRTSISQTLAK